MIWLNLFAILFAPIVAVVIGQWLHVRAERRRDKLQLFKILMSSRTGLTVDYVQALNVLDVVYSDDKEVRTLWKQYYDKLCVEKVTESNAKTIKIAQEKLLEAMAKSLGYKNKITWETIQNPYIPQGLVKATRDQQEFQRLQLEGMRMMLQKIEKEEKTKIQNEVIAENISS